MAFETERVRSVSEHGLTLDDRERLTVTGVEEVESFDENSIVMVTGRGTLVVRGSDLHIEQLSLDGGQLRVEGNVESLAYEDDVGGHVGLWGRLFR